MNIIDGFLNKITMYRLVLYYLAGLVAIAAIFGALGWLPYGPTDLLFEAIFFLVACWAANGILAGIFGAHPNSESAYITALILTLIISPQPPLSSNYIIFLIVAAGTAMGVKYIVALNKKHIFNPAAFAVAASALLSGPAASWWVGGNIPLMAFVIAGGFLVVRKIQRFDLALSFLAAAFIGDILTHPADNPLITVEKAVLHTPLFFFASIMITEPLTTPPTRPWRIEYGALVGLLFSPAIHFGPYYSTPELALLAGNIFSYAVSPKGTHVLTLKGAREFGENVADFSFATEGSAPLAFAPGQYLEWTLAHERNDGRGNRRYFTIASSPTERDVHLGVKFYEPSSSFKKRLRAMRPGDTIVAGHLAGDFTLPRDPSEKLAFVAGGIGITPFRSMAKYMTDTSTNGGPKRDAVLLYSNRTPEGIAYAEVFDEAAEKIGMRTVYSFTRSGGAERGARREAHIGARSGGHADRRTSGRGPGGTQRGADKPERTERQEPVYGTFHEGRITADLIRQEVPDWKERTFYVSGTRAMTTGIERILADMGVSRARIKIDFFPGFA